MSKRFVFPVLLWTLVGVVGYVMYFGLPTAPEQVVVELVEEGQIQTTPDGRAISTIPWGFLPDVDRFVLTDQEGNEVDSADLHGTPYVVSFFFSTCPSICRDLNKQIRQSNDAVADQDIRFLTISVQPDVDTVSVLKKYADSFDAKADRWSFLTGPLKAIEAVGEGSFNVVVDPATHTDDILLVDKWGRNRDRFKWSSPEDMKRFIKVVKDVAQETEPPLGVAVQTRNVMAGIDPPSLNAVAWLRDFHLDSGDVDQEIFSRQFTGEVWLAHFATDTDGVSDVEGKVRRALKGLPLATFKPIPLLEISDSKADSPAVELGDKPALVKLISGSGEPAKLQRIAVEYFGTPYDQASLAKQIFVVDRWGNVRDKLDVEAEGFAETLRVAVTKYAVEQKPGPPTFGTVER